jgi:hypothetical protein
MQARIVDSEELACNIGKRHGLALDLNFVDGAHGHIGNLGGSHKRHTRSLLHRKMNRKLDQRSLKKPYVVPPSITSAPGTVKVTACCDYLAGDGALARFAIIFQYVAGRSR